MKNKRNGSGWNKIRAMLCRKPKVGVRNNTCAWESRVANEADEWEVAQIWHSLLKVNHSKYQEQKSSTQAQCWAWTGRHAKGSIKNTKYITIHFYGSDWIQGDGWIDR